MQRTLEGRSLVLRERLLRDEQRGDFALRNLDARKSGDRFRVVESKLLRVVTNRQSKPIAHKIDVTLDRFWRDLEFRRDLLAVWKVVRLQRSVQLHHSLQRRAGKPVI